MLQLPAGRLERHAPVKDDVVAVGQAVVGVHPQRLQRGSSQVYELSCQQ